MSAIDGRVLLLLLALGIALWWPWLRARWDDAGQQVDDEIAGDERSARRWEGLP